ncbi:THO complex subunit 1 transcription elongation factor-domain-containing protein [Geranomyces variabilis]|nr:THO complex subunit 1 transcription elongation factor-domain-containing protein [Geranomyces variabilis]KAJ3137054.1 hypothetical protein HDU90_002225 [Geranomyces variabilis]
MTVVLESTTIPLILGAETTMPDDTARTALTDVLGQAHKAAAGPEKDQLLKDLVLKELVALAPDPVSAAMLATAFTSVLFDLVYQAGTDESALFDRVYDLLDIALCCTEAGIQDQSLPFGLIEDFLDVLTINGTDRVVDYLESRADRLTVNIDPKKGKGLTLLRLCNEILRRLSNTINTVTAGRILMFMANVYPLAERSGVNMRGDFNTKNETHYEGEDTATGDAMDVDLKETPSQATDFYKLFWNLQRYVANPTLLCEMKNYDILKQGMEAVFDKFDQVSKEEINQPKETGSAERKRKNRYNEESNASLPDDKKTAQVAAPTAIKESFFPKFLTRPELFDLEIADPHFRRQILAQFSIVLQFLSMLSQYEKDRAAKYLTESKAVVNKAVQHTYTLTPEQEKWVTLAKERTYASASSTVPSGKQFAKNLHTVITHERNWIEWKNRSCQTFEAAPVNVQEGSRRPKLQGSETVRRDKWLGSDDMTALWAKGDDPEAVMRDSNRRSKIPDFKHFIDQIDEQLDAEGNLTGGMEAEYALHGDMRFSWRMYRTALRHDINLYQSPVGITQIDSKAPAKSLLMEWRREKHRAENPTLSTSTPSGSSLDANQEDSVPNTPVNASPPPEKHSNGKDETIGGDADEPPLKRARTSSPVAGDVEEKEVSRPLRRSPSPDAQTPSRRASGSDSPPYEPPEGGSSDEEASGPRDEREQQTVNQAAAPRSPVSRGGGGGGERTGRSSGDSGSVGDNNLGKVRRRTSPSPEQKPSTTAPASTTPPSPTRGPHRRFDHERAPLISPRQQGQAVLPNRALEVQGGRKIRDNSKRGGVKVRKQKEARAREAAAAAAAADRRGYWPVRR